MRSISSAPFSLRRFRQCSPPRELPLIKVPLAKLFGTPGGFDALCRHTSCVFGVPLYKSLVRVRPRGVSATPASLRVRGVSSCLRRLAVPAASALAVCWRRSLAGYVRARDIHLWMSTIVSSRCCSRGGSTLCGPFFGSGWFAGPLAPGLRSPLTGLLSGPPAASSGDASTSRSGRLAWLHVSSSGHHAYPSVHVRL